jgi:hypothetical protein
VSTPDLIGRGAVLPRRAAVDIQFAKISEAASPNTFAARKTGFGITPIKVKVDFRPNYAL